MKSFGIFKDITPPPPECWFNRIALI
jgi:hypothetical protein